MQRWLVVVLWLVLLLVVAIRFAEPVGDGDLFWQMAYGKQLLENHTLIPDHTLYSWTPTSNSTIYCSWLAEIFFYLGHKVGGLELLFVFRYACLLLVLALAWQYLRSIGADRRPEAFLLLICLTLTSYVGSILKPEIFSLVFLNLFAWCYFTFKRKALEGHNGRVYLIALPILMVAWVNSHGVYVFGLVALVVAAVGEGLNYLLSPMFALPRKALRDYVAATIATGAAIFATPYGYRYPLQLFAEWTGILGGTQSAGDKAAYKSLAAHMKIFDVPAFHFVDYMELYLVLAAVMLTGLFFVSRVRASRSDDSDAHGCHVEFTILLLNLVFAFLYTWYLRTTFYWPPFLFYSVAYAYWLGAKLKPIDESDMPVTLTQALQAAGLIGVTYLFAWVLDKPNFWWLPAFGYLLGRWIFEELSDQHGSGHPFRARVAQAVISIGLFGFFATRSLYESVYYPYSASWCGFGITYWNPVVESEWIARFNPVDKLYNDYDSGGYLIWRLYPQTKVMIDPRSFPYRSWYKDYIDYEHGLIFDELLSRPDFESPEPELSLVSLKNTSLWRSYAQSKKWVCAWIGPSYVIFCRPGKQYPDEARKFAPDRFRNIKNSQKLLQVFQFSCEVGLYDTAWQALDALKEHFYSTVAEKKLVQNLEAYKGSIQAIQAQDLGAAIELQERCRRDGLFYSDSILLGLYQERLRQLTVPGAGPTAEAEMARITQKMDRVEKGLAP